MHGLGQLSGPLRLSYPTLSLHGLGTHLTVQNEFSQILKLLKILVVHKFFKDIFSESLLVLKNVIVGPDAMKSYILPKPNGRR